MDPAIARFVVGCVVAVALLVPISFFVVGGGIRGGADAWQGFAANSRKHLSTPLNNNMGLKTVLEFNPKTRAALIWRYWVDVPADTWVAARRRASEERQTIVWVARVLLALVVLGVAARQEPWVALILGVGLIPIGTELTCYYYSVLMLFGLLWERHRIIGVALAGLSAVSSVIPAIWTYEDDIYAAESLAVLMFVMFSLACVARGRAFFRLPKTSPVSP